MKTNATAGIVTRNLKKTSLLSLVMSGVELETIFVETYEPSHPFGVKAVAEIPLDGVAPAVGNAVLDACGVHIDANPVTPEKVWQALQAEMT